MTIRWLALPALAALLAFGVFAPACGGGGGETLTLEEFFQELQTLDDTFQQRSDELNGEVDALGENPPLDEFRDLLRGQVDIVDDFVDGVDDLKAPDEAKDLQDQAVSAGRGASAAFSDALDSGADAATLDELFTSFDTPEFNDALDAFDQACFDAGTLAADNGITIHLSCDE